MSPLSENGPLDNRYKITDYTQKFFTVNKYIEIQSEKVWPRDKVTGQERLEKIISTKGKNKTVITEFLEEHSKLSLAIWM